MLDRGVIGKNIGQYKIVKLLGQGGMAAVYQATDQTQNRQVAIKIMHPHLSAQKAFQQRFLQEAQNAARLDHPNIVKTFSYDHIDEELFIVMELVAGGNLRSYIKRLHEDARFMDLVEIMELIRQLASALAYAHRQGMMHRDIKPDNVVLKPIKPGTSILRYQPLLTDFGLARLTETADEMAATDQPVGTYPYMSPEQCLAEHVDTRTDIYALGIMLYELALGRLPYQPRNIAEAARMHANEPLPRPSTLRPFFPPELETIIVKALEKKPENRYQTADEMVSALQLLLPKFLQDQVAGVPQDYATDYEATPLGGEVVPLPMPEYMPPPRAAEDLDKDRLIILANRQPPRFVFLTTSITTLGRDNDQTVVLTGDNVSRHHLRIERLDDGRIRLIDVGSRNGTWLGETRLRDSVPVAWDGREVVRIGDYWIRLETAASLQQPIPGIGTDDSQFATDSGGGEFPAVAEDVRSTQIVPAAGHSVARLEEMIEDIPVDPLLGKQISHYRIDRFLGAGSVASVYEATDLDQRRKVSLRLLHDYLAVQEPIQQQFMEEARIATTLDHPNILPVIAFDHQDNNFFMVMELVKGGTLRGYIKKLREQGRQLDYSEIIDIARQVADGLHYAHQQGLLHRDLKPESVLLRLSNDEQGKTTYQPVLSDFGLARIAEAGDQFITDQPNLTYPYMSPEECTGQRVDPRSDIYELGILMYELTTGRTPYQPRSLAEAVRMHTREPLIRPAELRLGFPPDLERVIVRCLEKDPNDRFQNANETSRMLQTVLTNLGKAPAPGGALRPAAGAAAEIEAAVPLDEQATVPIIRLPDSMPMHTPQPYTAEQSTHDRMIVFSEDFPTRAITLNQDVMTVGRSDDQTLHLESKKVSRRHARIERSFDNQYRLVDLGSTNGTWLGNIQLIPNVSEVWEPSKTVRIGDFWMRLELVRDAEDLRPVVADGEAAEAQPEAAVVHRPAVQLPPPEHDKVGLNVPITHMTVTPGSTAAMAVELSNQSAVVDHFRVELKGLPAEWVTVPKETIYLLPNNRSTTSITFHPPLATSSTAGDHAFEVSVTTRAQGIQSVPVQGLLTILPFHNFTSDIDPPRVKGRRLEVTISNTGNAFASYGIVAKDREDAVRFDLGGKQYVLPSGRTETIPLRVTPRHRPLTGSPQSLPFEVIITELESPAPPQTHAGEVVVRSRFSLWMLLPLLLLCIICALISGGIGLIAYRNNEANQTVTAVAFATYDSATATATAGVDTDHDGLSDAEEIKLGTDPKNPDTDQDGLTDGQEVKIYGTNPLNRDTDGDNLSDGDEVNKYGTNPTKADSDGDGIPDNVDPFPLGFPTPTLTPFPTLVGTNGEICAGSPPTQLKIGIDAFVTPGGVANRLRDNPGKKEGAQIGLMPPESPFKVIDGPVCDPEDQIRWWKVIYKGQTGWTAEGEGTEYYLAPKGAPTSTTTGQAGDLAAADLPITGATDAQRAATDKVLVSLPAPTVAVLDRSRMGIQMDYNLDPNTWSGDLNRAGQLGLSWVKVQVDWSALQPNAADQFDAPFTTLQAALNQLHGQGLRVLVSVVNAPPWARKSAQDGFGPPDDPQLLADFLTFFLQKVGSSVDAVEVWNEPNLRREWAGALPFNGGGYMTLFKSAYAAVRAYSPSIIIVTAGLAPTADSADSVNDRKFLRQMYAAGLAQFTDVMVGIHPYGWGNPPDARCCAAQSHGWDDHPQFFFLNTVEDYHSIMLENKHTGAKLWATEFGWATWAGMPNQPPEAWMAALSPDDQTTYTLRAFQVGQALDYMGVMFLWNLNFANPTTIAQHAELASFSLVLNDSQVRPLFTALAVH